MESNLLWNIYKELNKLNEELIDMYQKELQKEIKANKYLNDTIDRLINEQYNYIFWNNPHNFGGYSLFCILLYD